MESEVSLKDERLLVQVYYCMCCMHLAENRPFIKVSLIAQRLDINSVKCGSIMRDLYHSGIIFRHTPRDGIARYWIPTDQAKAYLDRVRLYGLSTKLK